MELGFQPIEEDRIRPDRRFLPADVNTGEWQTTALVSYRDVEMGYIHAQRLADGQTEFAFKPIGSQRVFPRLRFYPHRQSQWSRDHVGRWVRSSEITIDLPMPDLPMPGQDEDDGNVGPPPNPTVSEMEEAILRVLFGGVRSYANYNDWGCPDNPAVDGSCDEDYKEYNTSPNATGGYAGGHSGWDAQTHSVRPYTPGSRNAPKEPFYSLTNGKVIFVGKEDGVMAEDKLRLIAVWTGDGTSGFVTRYLHAHSTCDGLDRGSRVVIGQQLGIQGNSGVPGVMNEWDKEHVHIEMQTIEKYEYGYGAGSTNAERRTINPVPTLYSQIANWRGNFSTCRISPPPAEELIRVAGTQDVYHVRDGYRRLIIAGGIINAVPQFRWDAISDVSQATMNRYEVSRLVRLPNDGDKVYLVEPTGADTARLRHIPSEEAFTRAGCAWAAVYDITAQEASFSGYTNGPPMPASGWPCR